MTWILGEFPTEVWVNANAMFPDVLFSSSTLSSNYVLQIKEIGDVDNAVINFRFPSGTLGLINNCRYAAFGHDQRMEVSRNRN